ncbi:MAG: hypothetical protein ABFQ65_02945 [Nanoarchaeota archaeon]
MANPRPMTARLQQARNGQINSQRGGRVLPTPKQAPPLDPSKYDLKSPEGQIKFFTEATKRKRAEFLKAQRDGKIVKRTRKTAFTPRKQREAQKVQAQQLETQRQEFEAETKKTEAGIRTYEQEAAKQRQAQEDYKKAVSLINKRTTPSTYDSPEVKRIWGELRKEQDKYIGFLKETRALQRQPILEQLQLPPETTGIELQKALIKAEDVRQQSFKDFEKQNPGEKIIYDKLKNPIGVQSEVLKQSMSIGEYGKIFPQIRERLKTPLPSVFDVGKSTITSDLISPIPSGNDRAIATLGIGGVLSISPDRVDLSKIKTHFQKGKEGIVKFYDFLGRKTPKLYFDPSALKPTPLSLGYKPTLTLIPSDTTLTIKEVKELAKKSGEGLLSTQQNKAIENIIKGEKELLNLQKNLGKYPIVEGIGFTGTEKEFEKYLKDFSKYEKKAEQYNKSFKKYEDITRQIAEIKGVPFIKEAVSGLALKGIQYLPETTGQAALLGASAYGGYRLAAPILSGIQKTLPGRAALTGSGIYFTAEGVKGAIDPTLTPEQRTLAGLSAGLGVGSGALSLGARARQFAKLRQLEKLRKTTPEISLGFARKQDKATELLVGARRRGAQIESQTITSFNILPTSQRAFQIQRGRGATRIIEKKVVKEPRSFFPKGKRTFVRQSVMDFVMPKSLRKFTFFGEGEQVGAKIITPTRAGEVIKKVPKRITPSVARIQMLSQENKLTNLMTGGFAKTEKGITGVVSGRIKKGIVRDYALVEDLIDIPTKKIALKEVTSGVKARFRPRDTGILIDIRKAGRPSVGRKPTGRAILRERSLGEGLVIASQLEREALAQATREITKVKPRITPPTFTGLVTRTETRRVLEPVVQKPVMNNLLVRQPTIDTRRREAVGVKVAISQKELQRIKQAQQKAQAQAQKQLQKQQKAQRQAQQLAQKQALKQEMIKPKPPVAKPPVVFDPFTSLTIPTRIPPKPRKKVAIRKPLRKKKKELRTLPTITGLLVRGPGVRRGRRAKVKLTGAEVFRFI